MEPPSSPPPEGPESLAWYKLQYEQLEAELAEFRESSKELEAELEKDIELAEKRERTLKERAEGLQFEVEEWKRKCKESKAESLAAQNKLEKEITSLRDNNRSLLLRLREIEVANDDFERQARNTTSSLEDMESKYNQVIERSVMLEEEMKIGEQEREQMRIETQRLKDEANDYKIENELLQDKVKKLENRHLSAISTDVSIISSPMFDKSGHESPGSTASSPLISTPPDSDLPPVDPPSPPMSDSSGMHLPKPSAPLRTPSAATRRSRLPSFSGTDAPKAKVKAFSQSVHGSRPPTTHSTRKSSQSLKTPTMPPALSSAAPTRTMSRVNSKPPSSTSLSHIRSLTAQMQRLEARVQSARSKLPAPVHAPPRGTAPNRDPNMLSSITVRPRKRTLTSTTSSVVSDDSTTPSIPRVSSTSSRTGSKHVPRLSASGVGGRLSFGPLPIRGPNIDADTSISRPSSRASASSNLGRSNSRTEITRPLSRTSMNGSSRTPTIPRPRSSMSGITRGHSYNRRKGINQDFEGDEDEYRTPSRRPVYHAKVDFSASVGSAGSELPVVSHIPTPGRRQSSGRRISTEMPSAGFIPSGSLAELEETY